MKAVFLAALMAATSLTAAHAAAPHAVAQVNVTVGPELQAKDRDYGQRDIDDLVKELKGDVESALKHRGGLSAEGGQLNLVLADATPNRPTFKQLSDKPGLSMRSWSLGGARIEGVLVRADGTSERVSYGWTESDIHLARTQTTWGDADQVFEQFADRVANGRKLAER